MTMLDLDQLFAIAEASPALDRVENELRDAGHKAEADALNKLQQDAGVQIDREINGYDENKPAPGPETARLNAAYEPVTNTRLDILRQVHEKLPLGELKESLASLMKTLTVETGPSSIAKPANKILGMSKRSKSCHSRQFSA